MTAALSMQDRIARTRRQQTRALDGASQEAARIAPEIVATARAPAANQSRAAPAAQAAPAAGAMGRNPEFQDLTRELLALAPAAERLYGYGPADLASIKDSVAASRPGAILELRATVEQWRIAVVTAGLDTVVLPSGAPLLSRGVADRARSLFRMRVLSEAVDENGNAYRPDSLDWTPELAEWEFRPGAAAPGADLAPAESAKARKNRKP